MVTVGVKFLLFLYCFSYRNTSSQVRMLWEDHRNDLFINGFGECPIQRVRERQRRGLTMGRRRQVCSCRRVGASSGGVSASFAYSPRFAGLYLLLHRS